MYYHHERGLRTFLHGGDFATVGTRESVAWPKKVLESRFEIKTQCVGTAGVQIMKSGTQGTGLGPGVPEKGNGEVLGRVRMSDSQPCREVH